MQLNDDPSAYINSIEFILDKLSNSYKSEIIKNFFDEITQKKFLNYLIYFYKYVNLTQNNPNNSNNSITFKKIPFTDEKASPIDLDCIVLPQQFLLNNDNKFIKKELLEKFIIENLCILKDDALVIKNKNGDIFVICLNFLSENTNWLNSICSENVYKLENKDINFLKTLKDLFIMLYSKVISDLSIDKVELSDLKIIMIYATILSETIGFSKGKLY